MKTNRVLLAVTLTACLFCGCKRRTSSVEIRLSLILDEKSEWYVGAAKWKELVESASGGRYKVRIAPRASLSGGKQRTELEMLQSGVLHASLESTILLSTLDENFAAFSLPWLFHDYEHAERFCDGPVGRKMLDRLEGVKVVGLSYGTNGFRQLTNNRRRVMAPADLKGLKLRVPAIKMYIDLFRIFGADPSQMDFGELLQAIQTGAMDGQENPLHVIHSTGLYDIQKYLTFWNYSYDPLVLCVNAKFFNGLPASDREMLRTTAREAMHHQRRTVAQNEAGHMEWLREHMDVTVLPPDRWAPFKELQQKLYVLYGKDLETGLVDEFMKEAERTRQAPQAQK